MAGDQQYTISEVAQAAAVTVRTLHHYDEIGLLTPTGRSQAGYRLYGDDDIARLQQILFYRALGFPLREITRLMTDPGFDRLTALREQRDLLRDRAAEARRLLHAVDNAIRAEESGMKLSKEERLEIFDGFDPEEHREEVEERWGDSDAYRESARRTARYSRQDWIEVRQEMEAIGHAWVDVFRSGAPADSHEAMDVAERARLHIDQRFYPCTKQMHTGLGEMYVSDPRFRRTYESMAEGLAEYVRDAIAANAERP